MINKKIKLVIKVVILAIFLLLNFSINSNATTHTEIENVGTFSFDYTVNNDAFGMQYYCWQKGAVYDMYSADYQYKHKETIELDSIEDANILYALRYGKMVTQILANAGYIINNSDQSEVQCALWSKSYSLGVHTYKTYENSPALKYEDNLNLSGTANYLEYINELNNQRTIEKGSDAGYSKVNGEYRYGPLKLNYPESYATAIKYRNEKCEQRKCSCFSR